MRLMNVVMAVTFASFASIASANEKISFNCTVVKADTNQQLMLVNDKDLVRSDKGHQFFYKKAVQDISLEVYRDTKGLGNKSETSYVLQLSDATAKTSITVPGTMLFYSRAGQALRVLCADEILF